MKCPICEESISLFQKEETSNKSRCNFQHYSKHIYFFNAERTIVFELFIYGDCSIQKYYQNDILINYALYHKTSNVAIIPATQQLAFDPKNPDNVIHKIKTLLTFS